MACGSNHKSKRGNKKPSKLIFGKTDLQALRTAYRFSDHELLEFKQRFTFLSNAQDMLDKAVFRENMGLLGLDTGAFLADRIFGALDRDKDGYIGLEEYLKYFDILIYGSPAEKHELTFKMIDLKGKGWFSYEEFKGMVMSMLYTWNSLTGSHYNIDQNVRLDEFLVNVFKRFDIQNHGSVTLENFLTVVDREPQLLEIFDSFNQGILDSVQPNEVDQKDLEIIDELEHLYGQLNKLKEFVGGKGEIEVLKIQALSKSQGLPRLSPLETLKVPEQGSPRNDLRSSNIFSLDVKMRRTKVFEFFKEEELPEPPVRTRQLSEEPKETPQDQRLINTTEGQGFQRRRSLAPEGTSSRYYTHRKSEDEQIEGRHSKILDKFKSVDVVYQEGNSSAQSPSQKVETYGFSSFKQERQGEKKVEGQGSSDEKTPSRERQFQQPIKSAAEVQLEDVQFEIMTLRNDTNVKKGLQIIADDSPQHVTSNPSNQQTPNAKKLMLRIDSIPIAPKKLDLELDHILAGGSAINNSLMNSGNLAQATQNIYNTSQYQSPQTNKKAGETTSASPKPLELSPGTAQLERKSTTSGFQTVQLQQLTEQLELLAKETLKIIDEVRNKKKAAEPAPEIKEDEKKATAQNVPKVLQTNSKSQYVSFGHQNWNLVLNMMLGIQLAVKSLVDKTDNLTAKDFSIKYIFELIPKRTTETKTSYKICTFFDYAPNVFWEIRRLYGIRNDDYLRSIGPEAMLGNLIKGNLKGLTELTSSGKSGSFFYYSADGKYTLKTISRDEFHFFRKILSNYYTHMVNNPQTLMIKFFGLHKIRFIKNKKKRENVYFIIMANVFQTKKEIHVRYDLKGSTKGRFSKAKDPTVAKKDLNILLSGGKIKLPMEYADSFVDIIEKDSKFFEENHIIDYSLLMGIHYLSHDELVKERARDCAPTRRSLMDSKVQAKDGIMSWDGTKIYFFGIIDILTQFNSKKKAEYVFKRIALGKGISAVPPHQYAERFRKFIKSLVMKPM